MIKAIRICTTCRLTKSLCKYIVTTSHFVKPEVTASISSYFIIYFKLNISQALSSNIMKIVVVIEKLLIQSLLWKVIDVNVNYIAIL